MADLDNQHSPVGEGNPSEDACAFLHHSASTIRHNMPTYLDDKTPARQKRKRTSPEDQAILEAAYARDPKPDKPARLKLVEEVALGEKEVQIWFQNRRQSSRRRSRPLLPHEVVQYQLSRAANASQSSFTPTGALSPEEYGDDRPTPADLPHSSQNDDTPSQPPQISHTTTSDTAERPEISNSTANKISKPSNADQIPLASSFSSFQSSAPAQVGYLSNRRSALLIRQGSFEDDLLDASTATSFGRDGHRRLRKSTSLVRISMTSEGNAEITTKDTSDPSPPRNLNNQGIQGQLCDSVVPIAAPNFAASRRLQRSSSGRSRDSRAWEFWCDKEARSELGHAAEMDASGSATGAIGLLRSASGRNILGSMPSKRNSLLSRNATPSHALKRSKSHHSRSSLQRARTSFGRLQNMSNDAASHRHERSASASKDPKSFILARIPGNESDKENWSPDGEHSDTRNAKRRRHDLHSEAARTVQTAANVLQENLGSEKTRGPSVDDKDSESDSEIAKLGRSGNFRKSASVSSEDDLDCIQGLLSLSQGNWR